jgi:hypothetical protein
MVENHESSKAFWLNPDEHWGEVYEMAHKFAAGPVPWAEDYHLSLCERAWCMLVPVRGLNEFDRLVEHLTEYKPEFLMIYGGEITFRLFVQRQAGYMLAMVPDMGDMAPVYSQHEAARKHLFGVMQKHIGWTAVYNDLGYY